MLQEVAGTVDPLYRDVVHAVRRTLAVTAGKEVPAKDRLRSWYQDQKDGIRDRWNSRLFTDSRESALNVPATSPEYAKKAALVAGREGLNAWFSANFAQCPRMWAFGVEGGL